MLDIMPGMQLDREKYPVTTLMAERTLHGSKPGQRDDGARIAVVGQSGAMLGVRLGGMLVGLEAEQVLDAVDEYCGSSAAALGFAYAKARQTVAGTSIYYQDIANNQFINFIRPIHGQPIVDIPFLTYHVMTESKPPNWEKVSDPTVPTNIYVATAKPVETITISEFHSQNDVLDALHFSSRMPVVAGMPYEKDGQFFTDGAAIDGGFPLQRVLSGDLNQVPTHILALLTEPENMLINRRSVADWLITWQLRRKFPEFATEYWHHHIANFNEAMKILKQSEWDEQLPKIEVIQVPVHATSFSRLSKDPTLLYHGAIDGYTTVRRRFKRHALPEDEMKYVLK